MNDKTSYNGKGSERMAVTLNQLVDQSEIKHSTTMIIDRLAYPTEVLSYSVNNERVVVKIGWGLPYIMDETILKARIKSYLNNNFLVSNGGTTLEIAYSKGKLDTVLSKLKDLGFNTIEMSEGILELPTNAKQKITQFAQSNNLRLHIEIGRKNQRNQLSLDETIYRLNQAEDFNPDMLIVEGRETGKGVEIYDNEGGIKWDWVSRIINDTNGKKIMFEAPLEFQQAQLILRLGPGINLGNISMGSFYALKTQRLGLRGDTFGAFKEPISGQMSPSSRFISYILSTHGPTDQKSIMTVTGLNRRTVQNSLDQLMELGVVSVSHDFRDMRKKLYSLNTESSA